MRQRTATHACRYALRYTTGGGEATCRKSREVASAVSQIADNTRLTTPRRGHLSRIGDITRLRRAAWPEAAVRRHGGRREGGGLSLRAD